MILQFPDKSVPGSMNCELVHKSWINKEIFRLDFVWSGSAPKAGQFFMVKPRRSGIFFARPISVANWQLASKDHDFIRKKIRSQKTPFQKHLMGKFLESNTVTFLIVRRGKGTEDLSEMNCGEEAELTGPLGNAWTDFLPKANKTDGKPIALIGGGIGLAPLNALLCEITEHKFNLYAGFRTGFKSMEEKHALLGPAELEAQQIIIATEDGKDGKKGRIPDFLEPEKYAAVCACGPEPMLKAVVLKCKAAGVPCFVSMERRMACGVGACLGCTVHTVNGNRRCCADGPIFKAEDLIFDE